MEELFNNMITNAWDAGLSEMYENPLFYEMIEDSVGRACDFFQIEHPAITGPEHSTSVSFGGTNANDYSFFNCAQLEDMGITGRDGLDLLMTHEGTHRMLQGMEMELNSHQAELCCDYMTGVRAGLNGIDASRLIDALGNTTDSETLPEGTFRAAAIQAGMEYAKQFEQQQPPTFSTCLEKFMSGSMHDIMELEHLKSEMNSHECSMHHYQKALESESDNARLMYQFHQSESDYISAKNAFDDKYSKLTSGNLEILHEFSSDVSSASAKVESCQHKVNSLYNKLNSAKSKYGMNSDEYKQVKSEYDKAQKTLSNARDDYQKAVQYAHRNGTL